MIDISLFTVFVLLHQGLSPASLACMSGNMECLRLLVEAGAKVSNRKMTMRPPAACLQERGKMSFIELLSNK